MVHKNTLYPLQYNEKIPGRHEDARCNSRRRKEHDIHSLIYCMEESCGPQRYVISSAIQ